MENPFKILDWDSNFFDKRVAEISKNILNGREKVNHLEKLYEDGVDLAYYQSSIPLEKVSSPFYNISLINKKVPIEKKLSKELEIHPNIYFFKEPVPNDDLLSLAFRAGNWSRFNLDPKIDRQKVKELYSHWMIKSVSKEIASEVLVFKEHGRIKGMVTLLIDPPHGQTPLFAVDRESEGKGVSFALMRAADSVLYQKGCSFYTSATQADNKTAVTIFRRHGFIIKPVEYIYHLWRI